MRDTGHFITPHHLTTIPHHLTTISPPSPSYTIIITLPHLPTRCLDLGFSQALNSIVAALPPVRQTLLYSATQTRSLPTSTTSNLISQPVTTCHLPPGHL